MSDPDLQWQTWLRKLVEGDDEVVGEFWQQYGARLEGLAAKHLSPALYRREDPDDVVQSVCRTFLRRAQGGQFQLDDNASLWRLLCAITLTKVREKARFHLRQRRSAARERRLADGPEDTIPGVQPIEAADVSPDEAAEFADQLQTLLADLDDEERQLVEMKLEDRTNQEIADRFGCSERTVRRILKRVQSRLKRMLEEPAP